MATRSRIKNVPKTSVTTSSLPNYPKGPTVTYKPTWESGNQNTFYRAEKERLAAERMLEEAKGLIEDAKQLVDRDVTEVEVKLQQRIGDVDFWRGELDNKLSQLKLEIEEAANLKIRVENQAKSVAEPMRITQQCITARTQRQGVDLIRDDVDINLDKELDALRMSQGFLGQTGHQMAEQIRLLKKCKFLVEKDLSEKDMAHQVDEVTQGIKITSLNVKKSGVKTKSIHHTRGGIPTTVDDWTNLTQVNLSKSSEQLSSSFQLRSVIQGILAQVASNLKTHVDITDDSLNKRIHEVRFAKTKLEEQRAETIVKVQEVEDTVKSLNQALMAKQGPLASCQARIQQRRLRPGAEYCHDQVDNQLATEQRNLLELINKLEAGLVQAQQCLVQLQRTQLEVEDEIAKKANSLYIDEVKCGTVRKSINIQCY